MKREFVKTENAKRFRAHVALQAMAEVVPSTTATTHAQTAKADFSDLAMQLYGDEIEAKDRAAETARDARLKEMESFDATPEDTGEAGKKVAGV